MVYPVGMADASIAEPMCFATESARTERGQPLFRAFVTAVEPQCVGQPVLAEHLTDWLAWALGPVGSQALGARFLDRSARMAGIDSRYSCVEDHFHCEEDRLQLYRRNAEGVLTAALDERMRLFERLSAAIARRALAPLDEPPDHLLQVSCTGYSAPSAIQTVAEERNWVQATKVHSLGHMGCHAAVSSLRTAADAVCCTSLRRQRPARASVLHVELCTLHLQPDPVDRQWLTHAALFADGAARIDVSTHRPCTGLELVEDFEQMVPGTGGAMTWQLGQAGFRMHLGKEVVPAIRTHTRKAVVDFLALNGLELSDISQFALHPGGPRILGACAEALDLPDCAYRHSTEVFRTNGNMSSATLPHVWAEILRDTTIGHGELVCTVAFGPGLTVCGNLMRVLRR